MEKSKGKFLEFIIGIEDIFDRNPDFKIKFEDLTPQDSDKLIGFFSKGEEPCINYSIKRKIMDGEEKYSIIVSKDNPIKKRSYNQNA